MGVEKAEVRIGVANEIGASLDDALESAASESSRFEGGVIALSQAAKHVQALAQAVDDDVDGKGDGQIPDLATAKIVKRYITRAVAVIEMGVRTAENHKLLADGKCLAYAAAVKTIRKRVDVEQGAVDAVKGEAARVAREALSGVRSDGDVDLRAPGSHPGASVKTRRLAEEVKAAPSLAPTPSEKRTRAKPPPKVRKARKPSKRGRRPKADGADT